MFDAPVLLAFPRSHPREEGELLKIVCCDKVGVPGAIVRFEIGGCLTGSSTNEHHEFVVVELQDEFVVCAKAFPSFEPALLERSGNIVEGVPASYVGGRDILPGHALQKSR